MGKAASHCAGDRDTIGGDMEAKPCFCQFNRWNEVAVVDDQTSFGVVFEDFRLVWVAEQLQDGKWTARYCWRLGTNEAAGKALQEDALNGKSRRLLGQYDTEAETIEAIKQAVLLEAKWSPRR